MTWLNELYSVVIRGSPSVVIVDSHGPPAEVPRRYVTVVVLPELSSDHSRRPNPSYFKASQSPLGCSWYWSAPLRRSWLTLILGNPAAAWTPFSISVGK